MTGVILSEHMMLSVMLLLPLPPPPHTEEVSQPLPVLRVLRPGGLPVSWFGPGPSQSPPRHLAAGPEWEPADRGASVSEDAPDDQQPPLCSRRYQQEVHLMSLDRWWNPFVYFGKLFKNY